MTISLKSDILIIETYNNPNTKGVYVGRTSIKGSGSAICKVIDSDIATGNAIVYNRETNAIETITLAEKHTLWENIKKLAEDTENEQPPQRMQAGSDARRRYSPEGK